MQKKVEETETWLTKDYGKENEFSKFEGQCFELTLKQYVYSVCPYEKATQKEGHSSTSLGNWQGFKFNAKGEPTMEFTGGQSCWQGPQRSMAVKMICGKENKPLSVEEPSKCVYEMAFATPAVCSAAHAQALRLNLQSQLNDEDSGHGEL